jgi:hypothetical protein
MEIDMNEGQRAGWWAVVYLLMVGVAVYFTVFALAFSVIKQFWS